MTTDFFRKPVTAAVAAFAVLATWSPLAAGDGADNPHWNQATCEVCHLDAIPTPDNLVLQTERAEQLCEGCHGSKGNAKPCHHSSDIAAGDHRMPDSYLDTLWDGQVVCTTCHDLAVQCLSPHESYRSMNPGFVRDRHSRNRGKQCFKCHDASGFEQLNPHAMEAGDPARATCTICHASMPVKEDSGWRAVDFNMPDSPNDMCTGCHNVQPHPGNSFGAMGWNHLAVPSAEIRDNMQETEKKLGFVFPLDPSTGEVHCATCHNPHDDDLEGYPVADAPGPKYRLRVDNNCQACHDL